MTTTRYANILKPLHLVSPRLKPCGDGINAYGLGRSFYNYPKLAAYFGERAKGGGSPDYWRDFTESSGLVIACWRNHEYLGRCCTASTGYACRA